MYAWIYPKLLIIEAEYNESLAEEAYSKRLLFHILL